MWRDAATGNVQGQFSYRDTDPVGAQITQTKNALTVGNDDDFYILVGPVFKNLFYLALVFSRDIHAAWSSKQMCVFLACLTDRWRINERHDFFNVMDDEFIKQAFITRLQGG